MSAPDPRDLAPLSGDEASRAFAEPWEAQAFALALQLHAQKAFTWQEWTQALSRRLAAAGPDDRGSRYYEHWLAALEELVTEKRLAGAGELAARKEAWARAYRQTPHGRPVELAREPFTEFDAPA